MDAPGQIDDYIAGLADWRGKILTEIRRLIHETDHEIVEEWKWMGTPTWSHNGIVAIANAHKDKVKMTFAQGASLDDPSKMFNSMLKGNRWRAIDFFEGDEINRSALRKMIRAAIALNDLHAKKRKLAIKSKSRKKTA